MSKRVSLTTIEKIMLLIANALNVNEIFAYRCQTRFNQQGSIGRKYYALLLDFVSTANLFALSPAPTFPATKRSYSSIRPHLNKLLPTLTPEQSENQPKTNVESSITFKVSNESANRVEVSICSDAMNSAVQVVASGFKATLEGTKSSKLVVRDHDTGDALGTFISEDWSNTCNFVQVRVLTDSSVEFLHDVSGDIDQALTHKFKNSDMKALMKYLYTDERIKSNLANLKESLKAVEFWVFPTEEQAWAVHHELKKILGFKYVHLWQELNLEDDSKSTMNAHSMKMDEEAPGSKLNGAYNWNAVNEVKILFLIIKNPHL